METIFGYFRKYPDYGILWLVHEKDDWRNVAQRSRSDSDHGSCKLTRRSMSGYATYIASEDFETKMLIEGCARMQPVVEPSSTGAETYSAHECLKRQAYPVLALLEETLQREPLWIHEMDSDASRLAMSGKNRRAWST